MSNRKNLRPRACRSCHNEFQPVTKEYTCATCRQAKADAEAATKALRPFVPCRTCGIEKQDCSVLGFCAACRKAQREAGAKRRHEIYLECRRKREEEEAKRNEQEPTHDDSAIARMKESIERMSLEQLKLLRFLLDNPHLDSPPLDNKGDDGKSKRESERRQTYDDYYDRNGGRYGYGVYLPPQGRGENAHSAVVNTEMIDADNQADIDSAFAQLMEGFKL